MKLVEPERRNKVIRYTSKPYCSMNISSFSRPSWISTKPQIVFKPSHFPHCAGYDIPTFQINGQSDTHPTPPKLPSLEPLCLTSNFSVISTHIPLSDRSTSFRKKRSNSKGPSDTAPNCHIISALHFHSSREAVTSNNYLNSTGRRAAGVSAYHPQ